MLLSINTLPKHAVSVLPGGATKLLPQFIGLFTVVEEVGDLNYRLSLPPYMKTHPLFYVCRLKRYVHPQEITYPHGSNVSDHVDDHVTNNGAVEGRRRWDTISRRDPHPSSDLRTEEDCAPNARLSSTIASESRP